MFKSPCVYYFKRELEDLKMSAPQKTEAKPAPKVGPMLSALIGKIIKFFLGSTDSLFCRERDLLLLIVLLTKSAIWKLNPLALES